VNPVLTFHVIHVQNLSHVLILPLLNVTSFVAKDRLDQEALADLKVPVVIKDQEEIKVKPVTVVPAEIVVNVVKKALAEIEENVDHKDHVGNKAQEVPVVKKENVGIVENVVLKDHVGNKDQEVPVVKKENVGIVENAENKDHVGNKDQEVKKVIEEIKVPVEIVVNAVNAEPVVLQVNLDQWVL